MYMDRLFQKSAKDRRNRDHLAKTDLDLNDSLAAAAAVGDLKAVVTLRSKGATVLDWPSEGSKGFGSSLNTDAAMGNMKILELILKHAHREIAVNFTKLRKKDRQARNAPTSECFSWFEIQDSIVEAIDCAICAHQTDAAIYYYYYYYYYYCYYYYCVYSSPSMQAILFPIWNC
jgi:hypothetical protein